ncbi:MAG: esterase-like activity of phytase family protein [Chitinophagaceae bacterium]
MRINRFSLFCLGIFFISGCTPSKKINYNVAGGIKELRFINEYIVPHNLQFKGTTIGGLSGIDYDKSRDVFYMICDDPSAKSPARYYTVKLPISKMGIDSVLFTDVTVILTKEGVPYPDITKDRIHSADLEAMRYDPSKDLMIRSTEGQRVIKSLELQNPDIIIMNRKGQYIDSFELPANLQVKSDEMGPRHNSVFEGLDFSDNYRFLFVSVEEPLYEDGMKAGTGDSTAWVRFLKFDMETKKQVAQYAYQLSSVPHPADPPGAFKVNGVSDILATGNDSFLVIERAFSTGRIPSDVRIYLANASRAENITPVSSLKTDPPKKPMSKKLLLDMNKNLKQVIYNIEGVCFGPQLSNGHQSMIFVTDNNFNPKEKTQFLLFEVIP